MRVDSDTLEMRINKHSWNTRANTLYIDQPIHTGYSYGHEGDEGPMTQRDIARDLHEFLLRFVEAHPKYAAAPLILTGESYAG